ncbi:MAG: thioesterase [Herpetosiphonaceae bacterium]|nr:thioesterase [Herpetosiphonaceae bacterium]
MDNATAGWVSCPRPNLGARLRLFCLPYAGGGALTFRPWQQLLPREVELCLIHLPGREQRLAEPALPSLPALVEALTPKLLPWLDRPFALFGHSMGGLISFEVVRELRRQQQTEPSCLFLSAIRAPQLRPREAPVHQLPTAAFLERLRQLNGTPEEVLSNPELVEVMLPALRADFELFERYQYLPAESLTCPLTVFGGLQDRDVTREDLMAWREQTSDRFELRMLPGDHFFINTHRPLLLQLLATALQRSTR